MSVPDTFDKWAELIDLTDLNELQKQAIKTRIISVVMRLRYRLWRLSASYSCLRTTTTVGSLLVPSILTLQSPNQQVSNPETSIHAYWIIWSIGLVVSISNAFVSLFRVDKNYYTVGNLLEKIESESWLYLTQSGPYNTINDEEAQRELHVSHKLHFRKFMEKCEILINKAVKSEYVTNFRSSSSANSASSTAGIGVHQENSPVMDSRDYERKQILRRLPIGSDDLYKQDRRLNVVSSVDEEGRHYPSNHRDNRGGTPVIGISRPAVTEKYTDAGSDSTVEDDGGGYEQPRGKHEEGLVLSNPRS